MIGFGSIGGGEVLLLLILVLVLFGPRRIPEFGRTIGKTLAEFRRATSDFKVGLEREIDMEEVRKTTDEIQSARRELTSVARETLSPTAPTAPPAPPVPERPESTPEAPSNDDRVEPGNE